MVRILALASALAASAAVSGFVVPRHTQPATWVTSIMESYDTYHARYMALDCQDKHNTDFFTECCHPLKKNETLATARPAICDPANLPSGSSSAATPAKTNVAGSSSDDEEDCEDDDEGDDAEDDCEDDGDDTSSHSAAAVPQTTVQITSTVKAEPTSSSVKFAASSKVESTSIKVEPTTTKVEISSTPIAVSTKAVETASKAEPKTTEPATSKAPETTSAAPAKTTAAASVSSDGDGGFITGGLATFFDQDGAAGSCGKVNSDSTPLVAVQAQRMNSSLCGKRVLIENISNGKTVTAVVQDTCPGCQGDVNSLDLSHGAFDAIADEALGVVPIKWKFVD